MKAIVYAQYGTPDALELKDIEKPTPRDNEILIQVRAAAVNPADWHLLRGDPFLIRLFSGFFKPERQILGADVSGRVEAVGRNVKQFQPGDEVFGDLSECGWGGFAEYVCASEDAVVLKPARMTFEEAAAVPLAGMTALQGLRNKGQIKSGQKVLIQGASGGVGTFAVQIARALGAEVTGVCSTRNVEMVRALGADHIIDYTQEDFTQSGRKYDVILATNGYHSIWGYRRALRPEGITIVIGGSDAQIYQSMFWGPLLSMVGKQKMSNLLMKPDKSDLLFLKELLEAGKVVPVIDRRYPLPEIAEAMRYLEAGHARGKVVITMK